MKKCRGCKQEKAFEEFNKEPKGRDGLKSRCKACLNPIEAKRHTDRIVNSFISKQEKGSSKECFTCKKVKSLNDFAWKDKRKTIHWPSCRSCFNQGWASIKRFEAKVVKFKQLAELYGGCLDCTERDIENLNLWKAKPFRFFRALFYVDPKSRFEEKLLTLCSICSKKRLTRDKEEPKL